MLDGFLLIVCTITDFHCLRVSGEELIANA